MTIIDIPAGWPADETAALAVQAELSGRLVL
ncbi:endonuclease V, partial [Streptomyces sp. adm13(2018)]